MNIIVRAEENKDYRRVEEIAREAFWNLYFPGAHEHAVVHKMREHSDFIKDLAFVIEVNGTVEGAIFYTHSKIVMQNKSLSTISFGPVFISPKYHRLGLGKKLITHSINVAKNMGYCAIITLGYPYHYKPYGFVGGKKYGISQSDGKYYKGLLALPLFEGALNGVKGYAVFSQALEVTEQEVELFEKNFAPKEKAFKQSQLEFETACAALDE